MSKRNLKSAKHTQMQLANKINRLHYRQAEVYFLGSLKQVQANNTGPEYDGPDYSFYYTP